MDSKYPVHYGYSDSDNDECEEEKKSTKKAERPQQCNREKAIRKRAEIGNYNAKAEKAWRDAIMAILRSKCVDLVHQEHKTYAAWQDGIRDLRDLEQARQRLEKEDREAKDAYDSAAKALEKAKSAWGLAVAKLRTKRADIARKRKANKACEDMHGQIARDLEEAKREEQDKEDETLADLMMVNRLWKDNCHRAKGTKMRL